MAQWVERNVLKKCSSLHQSGYAQCLGLWWLHCLQVSLWPGAFVGYTYLLFIKKSLSHYLFRKSSRKVTAWTVWVYHCKEVRVTVVQFKVTLKKTRYDCTIKHDFAVFSLFKDMFLVENLYRLKIKTAEYSRPSLLPPPESCWGHFLVFLQVALCVTHLLSCTMLCHFSRTQTKWLSHQTLIKIR